MDTIKSLKCRECKREYPIQPIHVCEFCFGPLEVDYDYQAISKIISRESIHNGPNSIWRYRPLLPVSDGELTDMETGFTPLIKAENLGEVLGLDNLYLKNDTVNPTWSFKDRVVAVALARALEFGFEALACASTGNLAHSVAAHAAKAKMKAFIFIPHNLEAGKVLATAVYDPTLVAVEGTYDDVNRLCSEVAGEYPWAFVNINLRPFYAEGSKTLAFETAEQLGWKAPDWAITPVASGSMLTKIYKGFQEFHKLGLIPRPGTRMVAAQAEGCSPVATAWKNSTHNIRPVRPNTIAKSLAIGNPADGYYALKAIEKTKGTAESVTDEQIVEGITLLAKTEGIFAETAGGVTIGVLKKLAEAGIIGKKEKVVAYITGLGLKTMEAVESAVKPPIRIKPNLRTFVEALEKSGTSS